MPAASTHKARFLEDPRLLANARLAHVQPLDGPPDVERAIREQPEVAQPGRISRDTTPCAPGDVSGMVSPIRALYRCTTMESRRVVGASWPCGGSQERLIVGCRFTGRGGGMADAADLNSAAERHVGSNPSPGTIRVHNRSSARQVFGARDREEVVMMGAGYLVGGGAFAAI